MEKLIQLLKESIEFIDNQTMIILSLSAIAISLIWHSSGELALQIINSVVSGLLGMGMARVKVTEEKK